MSKFIPKASIRREAQRQEKVFKKQTEVVVIDDKEYPRWMVDLHSKAMQKIEERKKETDPEEDSEAV